jgi:hypothetical protein
MIKGRRYHFSLDGEWGIRSFSGELPLSSANVTKVVTKFRELKMRKVLRKLSFQNFIFFLCKLCKGTKILTKM